MGSFENTRTPEAKTATSPLQGVVVSALLRLLFPLEVAKVELMSGRGAIPVLSVYGVSPEAVISLGILF